MRQFSVSPSSVLVGMTVSQFVVMCGGEGIVTDRRQDGTFVEPLGWVRFRPYDLVWVAGTGNPCANCSAAMRFRFGRTREKAPVTDS